MIKSPPLQTEQKFIDLLINGDNHALADLYDKYAAAIFGIIVRITKDENMAENCLLSSFTEMWKQRLSYDFTKERLFTWMVKIAKSTTVNLTESDKSCDTEIREAAALLFGTDIKHLINEILSSGKNIKQLGIHKNQFCALELIYIKNYNCTVAAKELKMPVAILKTTIIKALKQLKKNF